MLSVVLILATLVTSKNYGYVTTFLSVLFILIYLGFLSYIFQLGTSDSFLSRFLRVNHREPFSYNRFMMAIGEILIASTFLAIAVAISHYFDAEEYTVWKVVLAIFSVLIILFAISFSITTTLIHCLSSNPSKFTNFKRQVLVGGTLLIISSLAVNFGVASGKGISSYYIQIYSGTE